ncbi:MAG: hypothetical protein GY774_10660 [Planctomycetes bacterium]|nr:hypothetical protein [Planctomycetota bacterium]
MSGKNEEFGMGEGKGKQLFEPCVPEDVDKIAKSNKDTLRIFAKKKFGHNLDCGQHLNLIRKDLTRRVQVALGQIIDDPDTDEAVRRAIERKIPRFLLHPVNRRVNPASAELLKRTDLIPCDKDGIPISNFITQEELKAETKNNGDATNELQRLAAGMEGKGKAE